MAQLSTETGICLGLLGVCAYVCVCGCAFMPHTKAVLAPLRKEVQQRAEGLG